MKEHKDAIRKLSLEYTKLLKQNKKLKEVIKSRLPSSVMRIDSS